MTAIKKTWVFLKTYWYIPIIIILLIVMRGKSDSLKKMLSTTRESYNNQIKEIDKINDDRREKENKLREEHKATLENIEEEFKKKNQELDKAKKKQVQKLVKKYYDKPDELADEITKRFGFKYVKTDSDNN
tara:strand:+ start:124 stop:516 length:393 start_codon:yes stop_codon:yes gene_type:complete